MTDRLVLALDGSTSVCGASLLHLAEAGEGWEVLASRTELDSRGQAKLLLPMVDQMLVSGGYSSGDLAAIVVGAGPGTFTGVRIAVATARALSLALQAPIAGVGTLSALAAGAATRLAGTASTDPAGAVKDERNVRLLVPVVDARRGQVFYGLYAAGRQPGPESHRRRWIRTTSFGVCDRGALGAILGKWGREAVLVLAQDESLIGELPVNALVETRSVSADFLVLGQDLLGEPGEGPEGDRLQPWLAWVLRAGGPAVPEAVRPIYVRSPDADIHITKMRDPWAGPPNVSGGSRGGAPAAKDH